MNLEIIFVAVWEYILKRDTAGDNVTIFCAFSSFFFKVKKRKKDQTHPLWCQNLSLSILSHNISFYQPKFPFQRFHRAIFCDRKLHHRTSNLAFSQWVLIPLMQKNSTLVTNTVTTLFSLWPNRMFRGIFKYAIGLCDMTIQSRAKIWSLWQFGFFWKDCYCNSKVFMFLKLLKAQTHTVHQMY